jgi:hypothetical protein
LHPGSGDTDVTGQFQPQKSETQEASGNPRGRIQCSTNSTFVGLDRSDRPYLIKAREARDFVFSDFLLARPTKTPIVMAA